MEQVSASPSFCTRVSSAGLSPRSWQKPDFLNITESSCEGVPLFITDSEPPSFPVNEGSADETLGAAPST